MLSRNTSRLALPQYFLFALLLLLKPLNAQLQLTPLQADSSSNFRGISALSAHECWVSGSKGMIFHISQDGKKIEDCSAKGYEDFDFRDIHAFDSETAVVLSAGLPAVILKTTNGGKSWKEVYRNEEEGVFFDAFDFWNDERGMAFSDAQGQSLLIIETIDGGDTWQPIPSNQIPSVFENQGGFAASGSSLKTFEGGKAIIGLGGRESTLLITENYGKSWYRGFAPIDQGEDSKGIFAFAFIDSKNILVVGGDYRADSLSTDCISISNNGGYSWKVTQESRIHLKNKYRSSILALDAKKWFAISRTGASYTEDAGKSWKEFPFYFYSASEKEGTIWVSGSNGRIGRISILQEKSE